MTAAIAVENIDDDLSRTRGADVDIAFRSCGSGPAVVLLHGTSANHAVWQPVADELLDVCTVIALDQRGHGRSDKPASGYAGDDFASDVVTVLDALGRDRALIAGHSLGARNAWLVAALHPERTYGAVCVDYTPWVSRETLGTLAVRVAAGDRGFADPAEIEAYLRERYPRMPADAVARRARWGYSRADDGTWRPLAAAHALRELIEGFGTRWDDEFRTARPRMTHIRGRDSAIVDDRAWERARAARRDDRWVVADDADHYVPEERPRLVADEIRRALAAHL